MKLVSFLHQGRQSFGCVTRSGIVDFERRCPGAWRDLKALIASGRAAWPHVPDDADADYALDAVVFRPPLPNPDKIICVAVNYFAGADGDSAGPDHPLLFLRLAASQVGHGGPLVIPLESDRLDYEGELAVVIGEGGRRIPTSQAFRHVAGYSCYNDGSVRDWQKHSSQFTAGKNFQSTGAFGPWIVTADEIGDVETLAIETRVNGVVQQNSNTARMIFSIPRLIAYVSTFTELVPGDVIVSGTPGGFGATRTPPEFLQPGDVVEVEIANVGTLRNTVTREVRIP